LENKKGRIRHVNPWKTPLLVLTILPASLAPAEDFKTVAGKEYKHATVERVESDGIVLRTKTGMSKVYFVELPTDVQERFHYVDPARAAAERANAIQKKRAEEGKEKDRIAKEILTKKGEQFAAAKVQATHAYQNSEKGTLSGQIFVATNARDNIKLGAQYIALFPYDGVNILLAGLHEFAGVKADLLQIDISAAQEEEEQAKLAERAAASAVEQAKAAVEQADRTERRDRELYRTGIGSSDGVTAINAAREAGVAARKDLDAARKAENRARDAANTARRKIDSLSEEQAYYYSDDFWFSLLQSPIQTAETDAEGKFELQLPRIGKWVIAAHGQRMTRNRIESYYWLQPVSLDGQNKRVQNLNNNNLLRRKPSLSDQY
jgi:hypothetical protein